MLGWLFGKKDVTSNERACMACDSSDVSELAPQAYRCNVCAYEGGDGYADWQDVQTRAAYDDWSVAQLREHAAAQLNEARGRLVAVDGLRVPEGGMDALGVNGASLSVALSGRTGRNPVRHMDEELGRQIERDKEEALLAAVTKLHAATITLDALVDKGSVELSAVLTDARQASSDANDLRTRIDKCLDQLG